MRRFLDLLKRATGRFDSHGLRHSERYLRSVRPIIIFLPIYEQALFVAQVVKEEVDRGGMVYCVKKSSSNYIAFKPEAVAAATTTQIGNMAYVMLYSIHSSDVSYAKAWLEYVWKTERDQLIHDAWAGMKRI
ncbi:MAG: hypothetical protein AAFP77_31270 [Bacteroidota bacterium]